MPVLSSSNLASAEYREADEAKGTPAALVVQFRSGQIYEYQGVPKEVYAALLEAGSPGKFMHENIRGKYEFTKLA